jgi:hypothetical protein
VGSIAADLNEAGARAVADQIRAAGGQAVARVFDIAKEAIPPLSATPVTSSFSLFYSFLVSIPTSKGDNCLRNKMV